MMTIKIPDDIKIKKISNSELPIDWNIFPHSISTQLMGNKFIRENKFLVFQVPSVVTKGDYNYLINPNHKDFSKIKITGLEDFPFDTRIFK